LALGATEVYLISAGVELLNRLGMISKQQIMGTPVIESPQHKLLAGPRVVFQQTLGRHPLTPIKQVGIAQFLKPLKCFKETMPCIDNT